MNIHNNILELIGKTPLVRLNRLTVGCQAQVVVKLENLNPCYSVKDRIGISLLEAAEQAGLIFPPARIIEPTSGNTGIGLALACTLKGYKLTLVMPENMSQERQTLLKGFGVQIVLTPAKQGMAGAVQRARQLLNELPGSFMPDQFSNPANPAAHIRSTAPEIWADTDGQVDIFVAGVGSGGTLGGTGSKLKELKPSIKCVAVEPESSPVLSGGQPGGHQIQGIGAGFIPDVLDMNNIDDIVAVSNQDAISMAKRLLQEEGILCGISSGANVEAALQLARRAENKDKLIVTIICDTGERYLSTPLFNS